MATSDQIQLIALLIAFGGLIVSLVYNIIQQKAFTKQMRLQFFAEFTKRYQEIIVHFPVSISDPDFDYAKLEPSVRDYALRYMRAYFDLCSEEYHLYLSGNLDEKTWKEWRSGIENAFSKKAYQDAWEIINLNSYYYSDFVGLVEEILNQQKSSHEL